MVEHPEVFSLLASQSLCFVVWKNGDTVSLHLPMPVRVVQAHPYVTENTNQVALMRGPLLYCLEAIDHAGLDLCAITLPVSSEFSTKWNEELLNGIVTVHTTGAYDLPD